MKDLIIVESPTKAKTIQKFVGKSYRVESSYGHVRDLPKGKLGVDVAHDFEPTYVIPRKVQKNVSRLRKAAKEAARIILATDEDREGEAIAWHLLHALKLADTKDVARIAFHEITKPAIAAALRAPRDINLSLVHAQQARRILDRLVGYKLSPFLWKKITRGLSAGRVQSVALRLIAEREAEIQQFRPQEYWTIAALLQPEGKDQFTAALSACDGTPIPKPGILQEAEAQRILDDLAACKWEVAAVTTKATKRNPLPPFITSTLQQEAARRLNFSAKKTMYLAQTLYENGHITYMRTDSVHLAKEALEAARQWIGKHLGEKYLPAAPRLFKTKSRLAQEAHEAIRPTNLSQGPEALNHVLEKDAFRLYELIWKRTIASQLPPAQIEATTLRIRAAHRSRQYLFSASGSVLIFDGFLRVWPSQMTEKKLPRLAEGEPLSLIEANKERHETEPPPRYTEASLVKALEQHGIGRPSTYAPIISVIQDRNYVEKSKGKFYLTELGEAVNALLVAHFPEIVDLQFTAQMEENLDKVAAQKMEWREVVRAFYQPFIKRLEEKYATVQKTAPRERTDEICERCGRPMEVKFGRFGKFLACSGFPDCTYT
ncbi:type I DNA topoisomerase, partial [Candidatus Parcubacteria bacterium]